MSSLLRDLGALVAGLAFVFLLFLALHAVVTRTKKRDKPPDD